MAATSNRVGRMSVRVPNGVYAQAKTNTYLTPQPLLRLVYACFAVDLDPCSNSGTPQVLATTYYVEEDNGLSLPWNGSIFCNPPYRTVKQWTGKFRKEYRIGNMFQGILLVAASQETGWYQDMCDAGALVCAIRGRLHFDQAPGVPCKEQARFPSSLFYMGPRGYEFRRVFAGVGSILRVL